MAKPASLKIGGIDHALVVRITGGLLGTRSRGRGVGSRQNVFVIPLNVLNAFALQNVTAADQRQLDAFFAAHPLPKVEASVVNTLHITDGSS